MNPAPASGCVGCNRQPQPRVAAAVQEIPPTAQILYQYVAGVMTPVSPVLSSRISSASVSALHQSVTVPRYPAALPAAVTNSSSWNIQQGMPMPSMVRPSNPHLRVNLPPVFVPGTHYIAVPAVPKPTAAEKLNPGTGVSTTQSVVCSTSVKAVDNMRSPAMRISHPGMKRDDQQPVSSQVQPHQIDRSQIQVHPSAHGIPMALSSQSFSTNPQVSVPLCAEPCQQPMAQGQAIPSSVEQMSGGQYDFIMYSPRAPRQPEMQQSNHLGVQTGTVLSETNHGSRPQMPLAVPATDDHIGKNSTVITEKGQRKRSVTAQKRHTAANKKTTTKEQTSSSTGHSKAKHVGGGIKSRFRRNPDGSYIYSAITTGVDQDDAEQNMVTPANRGSEEENSSIAKVKKQKNASSDRQATSKSRSSSKTKDAGPKEKSHEASLQGSVSKQATDLPSEVETREPNMDSRKNDERTNLIDIQTRIMEMIQKKRASLQRVASSGSACHGGDAGPPCQLRESSGLESYLGVRPDVSAKSAPADQDLPFEHVTQGDSREPCSVETQTSEVADCEKSNTNSNHMKEASESNAHPLEGNAGLSAESSTLATVSHSNLFSDVQEVPLDLSMKSEADVSLAGSVKLPEEDISSVNDLRQTTVGVEPMETKRTQKNLTPRFETPTILPNPKHVREHNIPHQAIPQSMQKELGGKREPPPQSGDRHRPQGLFVDSNDSTRRLAGMKSPECVWRSSEYVAYEEELQYSDCEASRDMSIDADDEEVDVESVVSVMSTVGTPNQSFGFSPMSFQESTHRDFVDLGESSPQSVRSMLSFIRDGGISSPEIPREDMSGDVLDGLEVHGVCIQPYSPELSAARSCVWETSGGVADDIFEEDMVRGDSPVEVSEESAANVLEVKGHAVDVRFVVKEENEDFPEEEVPGVADMNTGQRKKSFYILNDNGHVQLAAKPDGEIPLDLNDGEFEDLKVRGRAVDVQITDDSLLTDGQRAPGDRKRSIYRVCHNGEATLLAKPEGTCHEVLNADLSILSENSDVTQSDLEVRGHAVDVQFLDADGSTNEDNPEIQGKESDWKKSVYMIKENGETKVVAKPDGTGPTVPCTESELQNDADCDAVGNLESIPHVVGEIIVQPGRGNTSIQPPDLLHGDPEVFIPMRDEDADDTDSDTRHPLASSLGDRLLDLLWPLYASVTSGDGQLPESAVVKREYILLLKTMNQTIGTVDCLLKLGEFHNLLGLRREGELVDTTEWKEMGIFIKQCVAALNILSGSLAELVHHDESSSVQDRAAPSWVIDPEEFVQQTIFAESDAGGRLGVKLHDANIHTEESLLTTENPGEKKTATPKKRVGKSHCDSNGQHPDGEKSPDCVHSRVHSDDGGSRRSPRKPHKSRSTTRINGQSSLRNKCSNTPAKKDQASHNSSKCIPQGRSSAKKSKLNHAADSITKSSGSRAPAARLHDVGSKSSSMRPHYTFVNANDVYRFSDHSAESSPTVEYPRHSRQVMRERSNLDVSPTPLQQRSSQGVLSPTALQQRLFESPPPSLPDETECVDLLQDQPSRNQVSRHLKEDVLIQSTKKRRLACGSSTKPATKRQRSSNTSSENTEKPRPRNKNGESDMCHTWKAGHAGRADNQKGGASNKYRLAGHTETCRNIFDTPILERFSANMSIKDPFQGTPSEVIPTSSAEECPESEVNGHIKKPSAGSAKKSPKSSALTKKLLRLPMKKRFSALRIRELEDDASSKNDNNTDHEFSRQQIRNTRMQSGTDCSPIDVESRGSVISRRAHHHDLPSPEMPLKLPTSSRFTTNSLSTVDSKEVVVLVSEGQTQRVNSEADTDELEMSEVGQSSDEQSSDSSSEDWLEERESRRSSRRRRGGRDKTQHRRKSPRLVYSSTSATDSSLGSGPTTRARAQNKDAACPTERARSNDTANATSQETGVTCTSSSTFNASVRRRHTSTPTELEGRGRRVTTRSRRHSGNRKMSKKMHELSPDEVIGPLHRRGFLFKEECFDILNCVYNNPSSQPFRSDVCPSKLKDYYSIVKFPMCLDTIAAKLRQGTYEKLDDFVGDMRRIFWNCRLYNSSTENTGKSCDLMETITNQQLLVHFPDQMKSFSAITGSPKHIVNRATDDTSPLSTSGEEVHIPGELLQLMG